MSDDTTSVSDADVGAPDETWSRWLHDDEGRVVILRGTNVGQGSKHSSGQLPPAGAALYERFRDELGLNAVRFLIFWEAIEPAGELV
ncbi:MAG: hypothetical protein ACNA8W_07645 [Bradymonadaceae bacterium]